VDEVTRLLHSPVFWICTGVGSVVFNVASHYVILILEKLATLVGLGSSRFMRRRRLRFLKRAARLNRFVRDHPYGVSLYLHRSDAAKFTALGGLIIAALLAVASVSMSVENPHNTQSKVAGWLGFTYLVGAMGFANRGFQLERLFRISRYFYAAAPHDV
jgi:hypothetical protein